MRQHRPVGCKSWNNRIRPIADCPILLPDLRVAVGNALFTPSLSVRLMRAFKVMQLDHPLCVGRRAVDVRIRVWARKSGQPS